jgi:cell wall assembly regulator SMI1
VSYPGATIDGMATHPVEESWARVTGWLAANAPASHATLRPAATPQAIAEAERETGVPFPDALRSLLLINDGALDFDADGRYQPGSAFLPGDHRLLSAAEITRHSRSLVDILGQADDIVFGTWWHPQWILVGWHVSADGVVIDQRPGPQQGSIGEFRHEDGQNDFDWARSLDQFLVTLADTLEHGRDFLCFRPQVDDGCLGWDVIVEGSPGSSCEAPAESR